MKANQSRCTLLLIAGIAVIVLISAGIAVVPGWLPAATDGAGDILTLNFPVASAKPVPVTAQTLPAQGENKARARGRCAECGVVVSTREIDVHDDGGGLDAPRGTAAGNRDGRPATPARRLEITVRLADQSSRVLIHTGPADWRPGESVIVIDGASRSSR